MLTFFVVIAIIGLIAGLMSRSSPTIPVKEHKEVSRPKYTELNNYNSIPTDIRYLIENEQAFELAELLIIIENDGHTRNFKSLQNAIKYKNPVLSSRVDKIRIDLLNRNF